MTRNLADAAAAGLALALVTYSVSDGDSGHALVQVALLLGGAVLIFEEVAALLDRVLDPDQ